MKALSAIYGALSGFRQVLLGAAMLATAVLAGPALARLPGSADPAFEQALALWLADDEAEALPMLAALAQGGNTAARLLLAVIDKSASLQGPWLAHRPRDERLTLLRAPGGLSGRSWLHQSTGHPLARTWLDLMAVEADPEVIQRFRALGEDRAAREAFVTLVAREHPALRLIPPEATEPELLYLLWRGADPERRAALLETVASDHPQRSMMGEPRDEEALLDWLETSDFAAPLQAVCNAACPDSLRECLGHAYRALGSHNALAALGSPVESLIPQDMFLASPRGQTTVLRRILQSSDARGRRTMIARLQGPQACLAERLASESDRYRYRRPGSEENGTPSSD